MTDCTTIDKDDAVALCMDDLLTRLKTVYVIRKSAVLIYSNDDLMEAGCNLDFPCVGVIYMGLTGTNDSSKTGGRCNLVVDAYLLGGTTCNVMVDGSLVTATSILCSMRKAVVGKCVEVPQTRGKWQFVYERPVKMVNDVMGFVQRWQTPVSIF